MSDQAPSQDPPRIYVASLSDYNAGYLHGVWIDATSDIQDIHAAVQQMLRASHSPDAEEWAIHDHEGFCGFRLGEWESFERVSRIARGIVEHGPAFAHYAGLVDDDELTLFDDRYRGHWSSMADYAQSYLDDMDVDLDRDIAEWLRPYVTLDVASFGQTLASEMSTVEGDSGIYIFEI